MRDTGHSADIIHKVESVIDDLSIVTMFDPGFTQSEHYGAFKHDHAIWELHFIRSGVIIMDIEDRHYRINANSLVLIPPLTYHRLNHGSETTDSFSLFFSFSQIKGTKNNPRDSIFRKLTRALSTDGHPLLIDVSSASESPSPFYILRIQEELERGRLASDTVIKNLTDCIYIELIRSLTENRSAVTASEGENAKSDGKSPIREYLLIHKIDTYMHGFSSDRSLAGLADYTNMSRRNLERLLLRLYGMTFSEKLSEIRLREAEKLISEGGLTLSEIAEAVGYRQYETFRKAFIKKHGIPPSKYQENQ